MMIRRRARQEGYALISVLGSMVLLSLIAASLIAESRFAIRAERNAWRHVEAQMLAEAALAQAVLSLYELDPASGIRHYGQPQEMTVDGRKVVVKISDELGKMDLNQTEAAELRAIFAAAGASRDQAEALASEVVQTRQGTPDSNGAPTFRALQSIDELRLVEGMTAELFERVRAGVTVHSHSFAVDPDSAPAIVLDALYDAEPARRREVLARRSSPKASAHAAGSLRSQSSGYAGRAFTLDVELSSIEGAPRFRTIVRLTGDAADPFWVLDKRGE